MIRHKAAIFDMDGTLIDSMHLWRETYKEFLALRGLPVPPAFFQESHEKLYTRRTVQLVLEAYPQIGLTEDECCEEFMKLITRHYQTDVQPKKGALELLQKLHGMGVKVVLATATRESMAVYPIRRLGFEPFFDRKYFGTGASKSDPAFFRKIARELWLRPARCIVFEDAYYAMKGAKEAGCAVCAVDEPYFSHQRQEIDALADRRVRDFTELLGEDSI